MKDEFGAGTARVTDALVARSDRLQGTRIPISGGELILGRDMPPPGELGGDPSLSRRHARISRDANGRLWVEDLGSTNGTLLNGSRITAMEPLRARDRLDIGTTVLEVVQDGAGRETTQADDDGLYLPASDGLGAGMDATSAGFFMPPAQPVTPAPAAASTPPSSRREPPPRDRPSGPAPEARRGSAKVEGQIRGIQQRTERTGDSSSQTIWTFRLERYDAAGDRMPPIAVQMRGLSFDGSLSEGDEVRVTGRWRDGTLHSDNVENLTTRATVRKKSYTGKIVAFIALVMVLVVAAVIFVRVADNGFQAATDKAHQEFCDQASELGGSTPPGC
jgi:hypothetical protein